MTVGTLAYIAKDSIVIISCGIRNNKKHISEISLEVSVHSSGIKIGVTCTKNRILLKVCARVYLTKPVFLVCTKHQISGISKL